MVSPPAPSSSRSLSVASLERVVVPARLTWIIKAEVTVVKLPLLEELRQLLTLSMLQSLWPLLSSLSELVRAASKPARPPSITT